MDKALLLISLRGWDRCGETNGRLRFRRGDEEIEMSPNEVPFWAAQMERPEPSGATWEARRVFVSAGYIVGPRQAGITHNRRGETLFYRVYADAEQAATALNAGLAQRELF